MDLTSAIGRLALAALLGGLIGIDREWRGHAAGLRTNILVCAAAAAFADVSVNAFEVVQGHDPSRVASTVVTGIGFLGAGAIFALGGRPRGLTTAAALWASAAIGLAVGVGRWQTGVGLVFVALVALVALDAIAKRLLVHGRTMRELYVVVDEAPEVEAVQRHLAAHDVWIRSLDMVALNAHVGVDLAVTGPRDRLEEALSTLGTVAGVRFASDEQGQVVEF